MPKSEPKIDPKYLLTEEDHRYPRLHMTRLATGLDLYYVPDLATAKFVLSVLRTVNPQGYFACEYPTENGQTVQLVN